MKATPRLTVETKRTKSVLTHSKPSLKSQTASVDNTDEAQDMVSSQSSDTSIVRIIEDDVCSSGDQSPISIYRSNQIKFKIQMPEDSVNLKAKHKTQKKLKEAMKKLEG